MAITMIMSASFVTEADSAAIQKIARAVHTLNSALGSTSELRIISIKTAWTEADWSGLDMEQAVVTVRGPEHKVKGLTAIYGYEQKV